MKASSFASFIIALLWLFSVGHCLAECHNSGSADHATTPCSQSGSSRPEEPRDSVPCCNDNCNFQAYNQSEGWKRIGGDKFRNIEFIPRFVSIASPLTEPQTMLGNSLFKNSHHSVERSIDLVTLLIAPNPPPALL